MANRRLLGFGPLGLALALAGGGCGGGGGEGDRAFAEYWADGTEWCAYVTGCTGEDQDQCLASWPSVEQTEAAVRNAGISNDDLERCETAVRLLDHCTYGLTCAEFEAGGHCMASQESFESSCTLVLAAFEVYFAQNPATPVTGELLGSYEGSESGTFTGHIFANGGAIADVESPSVGLLPAVGRATPNGGLSLTAHTTHDGSDLTITFAGNVRASGSAGAFSGSGTWQSSSGLTGSWALQSP